MRTFALAAALAAALFSASAFAQDNLIKNGDLSQVDAAGNPLGWSQDMWGNVEANLSFHTEGGPALVVEMVDFTQDEGDAKWLPDAISVTPGDIFVAQDAYTATCENVVVMLYNMGPDPANENEILYNGDETYNLLSTGGEWKSFVSEKFTVPEGARTLQMVHIPSGDGCTLQTNSYVLNKVE